MKKSDRILVYNKYGKRCAYCGRHLEYHEMQVDHLIPRRGGRGSRDYKAAVEAPCNWMPSCRRCNHYKRSYTLESFRKLLKTLDQRINKHYINKVALDYGVIIRVKKWDGVFYFEKYKEPEELADDQGGQVIL